MDDARDEHSALVRLPISDGAWAESLPPAPDAHRVTVSLSSPAMRDEHGEALRMLGYVLVDGPVEEQEHGRPVAWLVVTSTLAREHPRWWASVRGGADAVYSLAMGPVVRRFGDVLAPHRAGG
jgi:hypothetical protein